MMRPKSMIYTPRDGWTIHSFPGTGHKITSNHPSHFLQQCHAHMELNNIPILGGWQDEMFSLMCEQNPEIECEEVGKEERKVAGADIWRFLTTLWEAMANGAVAVSEEEAERRAAICIACPKMGHTSCGGGCGKIAEVLSTLTLGRRPVGMEKVHKASCEVCGCEISSLVNYPLDVLKAVDDKLEFKRDAYPKNCWKLSLDTPPQDSHGS